MTAKKDIKRKKSKKKANKSSAKRSGGLNNTMEMDKPIATVVKEDKRIAIISLSQTLLLMAVSLMVMFAKDTNTMGKAIIDQNILIEKYILTQPVLFIIETLLVICAGYFIFTSIKKRYLKRFFTSGTAVLVMAFGFCITLNVSRLPIYSYGVICAVIVAVLQMLKLREISRIENDFKERNIELV